MYTSVITINQLTRHFKETVAVNNLSLEVCKGEIFGFLGHNGAGKTTTVRLLNGVIEPTSGSMRVLGFDPKVDGPVSLLISWLQVRVLPESEINFGLSGQYIGFKALIHNNTLDIKLLTHQKYASKRLFLLNIQLA